MWPENIANDFFRLNRQKRSSVFDVKGLLNGITTRLLFAGFDYGHHVNVDNGGDYRIANDVEPDPVTVSGAGYYANKGTISHPYRRLSVPAALCAYNVYGLNHFHIWSVVAPL